MSTSCPSPQPCLGCLVCVTLLAFKCHVCKGRFSIKTLAFFSSGPEDVRARRKREHSVKQDFLLSALPGGGYLLCHPLFSLPSSLQTVLPCGFCYMGKQSYKEVPGSRRSCFLHTSTAFCMNVCSWSSCSSLEGLDPVPAEDSDKSSIDFSSSEKGFIHLGSGSPSVLLSYIKPNSSRSWLGGVTGKEMFQWDVQCDIMRHMFYICVYISIICIWNTAQMKIHGINHTHNIFTHAHIYIHAYILYTNTCNFHMCTMLGMCYSVITVHVQFAKMWSLKIIALFGRGKLLPEVSIAKF